MRPAWRGTRRLLVRSVREYTDDRCPQFAAAIAYHVLFSGFPLAILAVGVLGLVMRDVVVRRHVLDLIVQNVPLAENGRAHVETLLTQLHGLSALGVLGAVGLLWSASGVMGAIRAALNAAWDTENRRSFGKGKLVDLSLVVGAGLGVGAAVGLTVVVRIVRQGGANASWLGPLAPVIGAASWTLAIALPLALEIVVFLVLYSVVPAVRTTARESWPGAVVAGLAFELVKNGFAVYVAHLAHYNRVYGPLGAVIAFMFFVYLAASVFLFGAEVASEYGRGHHLAPPPDDGPSREGVSAAAASAG